MKITYPKCETCDGAGTIDMTRYAYADSNPAETCPDCDGTGRGVPRIVYHPGDKVRIVKPLFVRRVGYPLVWHEVEDEQLYTDKRIHGALAALGLTGIGHQVIPRHLQIAFAKEYVLERGFGGRERTIHYHDPDAPRAFGDPRGGNYPLNWDYGGAEVMRKRVVKTGTYFPPYVPGAWAGPGAEGEPGGLENCKTHVLLDLGSGYEIEACNVKPWSKP